MNLVKSRNEMYQSFVDGEKPKTNILKDYRDNRNSESWRMSYSVEELCEYILYLEDRLKIINKALDLSFQNLIYYINDSNKNK